MVKCGRTANRQIGWEGAPQVTLTRGTAGSMSVPPHIAAYNNTRRETKNL